MTCLIWRALLTAIAITKPPWLSYLQSIFEDAVQMRASDIHIEPGEKVLRIRQRIDGQLHENTLR